MKKNLYALIFLFFIPTHLFSIKINKKEVIYGIEMISSLIVNIFSTIHLGETISSTIYRKIFNREPSIVDKTVPYFICAPFGATVGTQIAGSILNQTGTKFDHTYKVAVIGGVVGFMLVGSGNSIYSFIKKEPMLNRFIFGGKIGAILGASIGSVIGYNK